MKDQERYCIVIMLLVISVETLAQVATLVVNTRHVNSTTFSLTGPGIVTTTYLSGAGASGERVTLTPELPETGAGTIHLSIADNVTIKGLEILFDFDAASTVYNVRIKDRANEIPLNPSLFEIRTNEIFFYSQSSLVPESTLELTTNLIGGVLFDRSRMDFFEIQGLQNFSHHELRIYQVAGTTDNSDYVVFKDNLLTNVTGVKPRMVYTTTTDYRWNGCESSLSDPADHHLVNSGTFAFELDVWDNDNKKKTFLGQMIVSGI